MSLLLHPIVLALPLAAVILWMPASLLLLRRMRHACRAASAKLERKQAQLDAELFRLGRRDALTGLPSRQAFLDHLTARLSAGRKLTLAVLDLRQFAAIQAAEGEALGDELLAAVADRLRSLAETRETCGRLDGDEFGLLIEATPGEPAAPELAARLMGVLSHPYTAAGRLIDLPIDLGLACAPEHESQAGKLLAAARGALRHAKAERLPSWQLCHAEPGCAATLRSSERALLKRAVGRGEIIPWYQPIIEIGSGRIAKFEVLARWQHPELGLLPPDRFIGVAEEMGLAGEISMALLRQVAIDSREWPETFRFAFNVSAGQVRQLIGFLNRAPGDWQRRTDVSRFDVEITESALLHDRAMARELIDTLHEHGARAGLDDFGSGTCNFAFLRDMPFDSIKIGKPFIRMMLQDPRAEACVLAMLWLGHGLGVEVVADGVETSETAAHLERIGCKYAQGFFYAEPVPAEQVERLLRRPGRLGPPVPSSTLRTRAA